MVEVKKVAEEWEIWDKEEEETKKTGARKVSPMDKSLWKETI